MKTIDINKNITEDNPKYWNGYWDQNNGLGGTDWDPDTRSKTLREYHRILWSRQLPNGEFMQLSKDLSWNNMKFGSDSIIVSFRYKNQPLAEEIKTALPDYQSFFKEYIRKTNTIAGFTIFPKHQGSMNQNRGINTRIRDRWDLTMECIRRYYAGQKSPLSDTLETDVEFYNLFGSFKNFVDFFFLQDCVSDNYESVDIWLGDVNFRDDALPKNTEEYFAFIEKEMAFLEKRRQRIQNYCRENGLLRI